MADSPVQLTIDDTSPSILYSPLRDTLSIPNLDNSWNPYYNPSGFAAALGQLGEGTSYHITSLDGASITLQWHGNGIQLFGNTTLASYSITIDGVNHAIDNLPSTPFSSNTADGILADIQNLEESPHNLTLTAKIAQDQNPLNSSMLVFDKAVIFTSPVVSSNVTFKPQTLDDNETAFFGGWTFETDSGASFHTSNNAGDRAVASFNGTTFAMRGKTSPSAGSYTVKLDNVTTTLSGKSSFIEYDSLLFFATGLDTTIVHSVEVRNEDGGQLGLLVDGFSTFVPYSPPPVPSSPLSTAKSPSFSKGTIAAFILAGVLAFLLLTSILFFCLVWRPRRQRKLARESRSGYRGGGVFQGGFGPRTSPIETGNANMHMQERRWLGLGLGFGNSRSANRSGQQSKEREASLQHDNDRGKELDIIDITNRLHTAAPSGEERRSHNSSSNRSEARSGSSRWRWEVVEGKMRGILPIRFRHSDSVAAAEEESEKLADEGQSHLHGHAHAELPYLETDIERAERYPYAYPYAYTPAQGHVRNTSDTSAGAGAATDSSSGRKRNLKAIAMANLKNKGKARQITGASSGSSPSAGPSAAVSGTSRSWSPSFKVELPILMSSKGKSSKSRFNFTKHRREGSGNVSPPPSPGGGALRDSAYMSEHLSSFAAAAPSIAALQRPIQRHTVLTLSDHPPSYAASISHSQRDSASSSVLPSVPRSVSNSNSNSNSPTNPTYSRPPHHYREHSRRFLLHGDGDKDSEDESPVAEDVPRLQSLPPPPRLSSQPPTPSYAPQAPPPQQKQPEIILMQPLSLTIPPSNRARDRGSASSEGDHVLLSLSPRTAVRQPAMNMGYLHPGAHGKWPKQIGEVGSLSDDSGMGSSSPVEFARGVSPSGVALGLERDSMGQARPGSQVIEVTEGDGAVQGQRGHSEDDENVKIHDDELFLDVRTTSPFRVEFGARSARNRMTSDGSGAETGVVYYTAPSSKSNKHSTLSSSEAVNIDVRSSRSPEFVQGTSHTPFRLTNATMPGPASNPASAGGSDAVTSFLDFTSSREGSVRSRSIKTMGSEDRAFGSASPPLPSTLAVPRITEPRSRWSNTTVPSVSTNRSATGRHTSESSGEYSLSPKRDVARAQSDGEKPSVKTFPNSVRIPIPPIPQPVVNTRASQPAEAASGSSERRHSNQSNLTGDNPVHVHPVLEGLESPTESIPKSFSDVQFQSSDTEEKPSNSRRTTESSIAFHTQLDSNRDSSLPGPSALRAGIIHTVSPFTTIRPSELRSASGAAASSSAYTPLTARFDSNSNNDHMNSGNSRTND